MKDPAFLFYSDNFLSGTMFFTDEQAGKYIRLLCAQHQTGHLEEKHMIFICKAYDEDIWKKFTKDDDGKYYNERLDEEIEKRRKYSESRSNNKKGKTKTIKKISKSHDKHMGNGIGNGIEDINWRTNFEIYKSELNNWFEEIKTDYQYLQEQERFNPGIDVVLSIEKSIKVFWGTEAGWKNKKSSKTVNIDWKQTIAKNLDKNKVYKQHEKTIKNNERGFKSDSTRGAIESTMRIFEQHGRGNAFEGSNRD